MRKIALVVLMALTLNKGLQMCFGDSPIISITTSNRNVILSWPQSSNDCVLVETAGFYSPHCYISNDEQVCEMPAQKIIPSNRYSTNGNRVFVVLPINISTSTFYMLKTNSSPLLPPPPPSIISQ